MVKDIERISCKMSEFLKLLWINVSICALFRKMFVITKASSEQWKKIEKKIEKKNGKRRKFIVKWGLASNKCSDKSCLSIPINFRPIFDVIVATWSLNPSHLMSFDCCQLIYSELKVIFFSSKNCNLISSDMLKSARMCLDVLEHISRQWSSAIFNSKHWNRMNETK